MDIIRIVLADDHEIYRNGFKTLLKKHKEIEFVGEACNGKELIQVAEEKKPDVIVTDIHMPVMDGIQATRIISSRFSGAGVIVLYMDLEESLITDAVAAGAKGYLNKYITSEELIQAIKTVNNGENYYCRSISKHLLERLSKIKFQDNNLKPQFTEREIEVLKYLCKEYTSKETANALSLSQRTVEGIRENIQKKIGARNTVGMVVYAIRNRLVSLD